MDEVQNPFSPGAGTPPPELAGREALLHQAQVLFRRILAGRSERSMLLTGLRGVGKTVLLNEIERIAAEESVRTIHIEAHDEKQLAVLLAPHLKRVLFDLDRLANVGDKARRGLRVLKSFVSAIKISAGDFELGLDIDPEKGSADSGDIEADLPELFGAIGEAAQERGRVVAILIDEIQYFSSKELSALIMAMHRMQQRQLPIVLIGAGLPMLLGQFGESKSYAERLFQFPSVGPLEEADAMRAIGDPIIEAGESIDEDALRAIVELTHGYPYFLQEWGYQVWNQADASPIELRHVTAATAVVIRRLDDNFFRVRFDRLTTNEKTYLRAMAELGPGPHRSGEIAKCLGKKTTDVSPDRDTLIKKGMVYSPRFGEMAFTVPLFDEFMRRAIPEFDRKDGQDE